MVGRLLVKGMFAGLLAGLVSFGFARATGEPLVTQAIAFEAQCEAAKHASSNNTHDHDEEIVSRPTQAGLGLLTAVVVFGVSVGGLFALTFAFFNGRVNDVAAPKLSIRPALFAFLAFAAIPAVKYPPNPPSIGDPETIGSRTAVYFLFLVFSVAALIICTGVHGTLKGRLDDWKTNCTTGALYIVLLVLGLLLFPTVDEVPSNFPASLLWNFRIASVGLQLVLWISLGASFSYLVGRAERGSRSFAGPQLKA
ncbi:CbtA family protein [Burkholderia sp. THE68]|uniref:CbtA family protein n=1 Tax=Burkholderia sp. THE68 TaxID=758782 RepID=UPI00138A5629|nr:CbtA family protein [Burkholderia sp. THE68]